MVIYTEFLYVSVRGIILSIKLGTILHTTTHGQLTSLNTCVLHHGYIYRISVCFIIGIILSIKLETILHTTTHGQLTSLNTCVLHHGYIYRISVCFIIGIILSIKLETILHTTHGQLTSLNTCVLHHGYIYRISVCFSYRYNSEYQTRNYIAYYDPWPVNVSKYMCITPWLYIQNFCMFQFQV